MCWELWFWTLSLSLQIDRIVTVVCSSVGLRLLLSIVRLCRALPRVSESCVFSENLEKRGKVKIIP